MIAYELHLRIGDCLLDRLQLRRDFDSRPSLLDHAFDTAQIPLRAAQPLDDTWVALMYAVMSTRVAFLYDAALRFLLHVLHWTDP